MRVNLLGLAPSALIRLTLALGLAPAMIAGAATTESSGPQYTVLHSFNSDQSYREGTVPQGGMVLTPSGALLGTTSTGGDAGCSTEVFETGCGVVFELSGKSSTTFTVVHTFTAATDGDEPATGLTADSKGNVYGTTFLGGKEFCEGSALGCGTVFKLTAPATKSGSYSYAIVHSFAGGLADGAFPQAALRINAKTGALYGTTCAGGAGRSGTVFSLTPSGKSFKYAVLHSFYGASDGGCPAAPVTPDPSGNLYGTTQYGGTTGLGTVFKLKSGTWTETVLHTFQGSSQQDGQFPTMGVVYSGGVLYGATAEGGANDVGFIYSLTANGNNWKEGSIHDFADSDGAVPSGDALAIDSAGNLYGTTLRGGSNAGGTAFELVKSKGGSFSLLTLYYFCSETDCEDGQAPQSGLVVNAAGTALYGTTIYGGANVDGVEEGAGVAFMLTK
jgi:uncharacterized repeat protein (TIGR03803 family)